LSFCAFDKLNIVYSLETKLFADYFHVWEGQHVPVLDVGVKSMSIIPYYHVCSLTFLLGFPVEILHLDEVFNHQLFKRSGLHLNANTFEIYDRVTCLHKFFFLVAHIFFFVR
jgi:hypothetical protein